MRPRLAVAVTITAALAVTGCQSAGADKTGGETVVLRLATIDAVNDNGQSPGPQAFVDGLARVSGGRLKVEVVPDYGKGDPQAETDIVKAIAAGDLDGGWPATRAFANAGLTGLDAVEAPMTITSYAAEKALVTGPVAAELLGTLDGSGVVGLGLAMGSLRRPFAAQAPLLGVQDWKGARFRVYNSPLQAQAVSALGATPVSASFDWTDRVRQGSMRGGEADIPGYAFNGLDAGPGTFTSNVVLWPKVYVLSFSRKRLDALTSTQQGWVRRAAQEAVQASASAAYDDQASAERLCTHGVDFASASPAQLVELHQALEPVLGKLAADPTSGPLLREIQVVAAQHPPEVVTAGSACAGNRAAETLGAIPSTTSSFPDGVYRVQISTADVAAADLGNGPGWSGTWTLTVRDGTYELACRVIANPGKDCGEEIADVPVEVGDLRGSGQKVFFAYNPERMAKRTGCRLPPSQTEPGHCWDGSDYRMTWALSGDMVTFSDFVGAGGFADDQWLIKPWRKIG
jgi:TRAP-type C4-dicarboxylate transport system substrate-binding protein